ncbi:MAG: hypothetical protein LBR74_05130 [Eubacterium sp.]|jgi:hypothetical protein|nr:hypothetical protein [Eubacterium sp.]
MLKQISVFVENKAGRLCAIMETLNGADIDVRSLNIADTTDFGIVRIIVNNTDKALNALRENSFTSKVTEVVGFTIEDHAGALYDVIKAFDQNQLNIEYSYSMMGKKLGEADIIVRTDDNEKAAELLKSKGISIISIGDIV